ncbi:MAG TPA: glycosyltransferase [Pseudonocardiaceae bacterium]|nr:glycosyltransferase [Pseudonocardiaceae bacterium]
MITAVGVVVPARDESRSIGACVRSVLAALRRLPADVVPALCVVADRCTDDTAERAAAALAGWPARLVRNRAEATIGEIRDLGLCHLGLDAHRPRETWLLSTDADTTVAADWAVRHLELARRGLHAVAGAAELRDRAAMPAPVARLYSKILATARRPEGHGNVYGANLGVRADAYRAVGGFGPVATGEDDDLWRRLVAAGFRCHYDAGLSVLTSSRRDGRAPGGLAALLARLDREHALPEGA